MLTKQELIDVMEIYIAPLYNIIGAGVAFLVMLAAFMIVIYPFIRRAK